MIERLLAGKRRPHYVRLDDAGFRLAASLEAYEDVKARLLDAAAGLPESETKSRFIFDMNDREIGGVGLGLPLFAT